MSFKVMAKRCDQCLYGKNKIVSDDRRDELLRTIERQDNHFTCHKATLVGQDVCCRGDFDKRGGGKLGRFAKWCNVVEFVTEDQLRSKANGTKKRPAQAPLRAEARLLRQPR